MLGAQKGANDASAGFDEPLRKAGDIREASQWRLHNVSFFPMIATILLLRAAGGRPPRTAAGPGRCGAAAHAVNLVIECAGQRKAEAAKRGEATLGPPSCRRAATRGVQHVAPAGGRRRRAAARTAGRPGGRGAAAPRPPPPAGSWPPAPGRLRRQSPHPTVRAHSPPPPSASPPSGVPFEAGRDPSAAARRV